MAKAKKLPSGSYRVQVYAGKEDGKNKYVSFTAPTPEQAEYDALAYKLKLERSRDPEKWTVGEAIDKYIESKNAVLSPSTVVGYKRVRKNCLQVLMGVPLTSLNQATVQKAVNAEAKRLSPKSVRNAYGLLTAALRDASPDFSFKITLPAKQKKIMDIPAPEDLRKVMAAAKGTEMEIPILLAVFFGMRMSEIRGLRWEDVGEKFITVRNAMVESEVGPENKSTKSYSGTRRLLLPDYLKALLDAQERKGVYVTSLTGPTIYHRFLKLLEKEGLPHYRFHDLRHANASIMLLLNISDKYAMERGGWATNSTMKSVYQHTLSAERERVDNAVNSYISTLISHDISHNEQE